MPQAGSILTKARYTLSDQQKQRWSDARLLSLLNDGILHIASVTRLYNATTFIELIENVPVYDLSSVASQIRRVEHIGTTLVPKSFAEMDNIFSAGWQSDTADKPTHIVYDLSRTGVFRVFPIPMDIGVEAEVISNSPYGVITNIQYTEAEFELIDQFGDIAEPELNKYLKVYYNRLPTLLEHIDDVLDKVIVRQLYNALQHYVAGMAFKDNLDERNLALAESEMQIYSTLIDQHADRKVSGDIQRTRSSSYNPTGGANDHYATATDEI